MNEPFDLVRELFWEALDVAEPEQRRVFLQQRCQNEPALLAELQKMLDAHEQSGGFLEEGERDTSASAEQQALDPDQVENLTGQRIRGYLIREQLGEGGMGTVYVAEQSQPVQRKVALKVIRPGMATSDVLGRFQAERQALAMMDHPNIASIHDAGTTPQGLPFFAMELVRGAPITEYADEYRLSTEARLRLFQSVCNAVQHAHLKGIIHRDLKPNNVLVTRIDGEDVVKVIDFGVAKATSQRLTEKSIYTRHTQVIGTPMYMSPEQAQFSGTDVDTRSDVYSLGVLLYRLLSGRSPFESSRFAEADLDEVRRIIREETPPLPSEQVSTLEAEARTTLSNQHRSTPERMVHALRGELDWIVMKAMDKDRDRRYESASALAADIECYLSGDVVSARPPTWSYQLQKYVRRHRRLLASASVLIVILVAATGVSLNYAWQANVAKNDAIDAQKTSDKHLQSALDAVDNLLKHASNPELIAIPRVQPLVKNILADSLAFYKDFEIDKNTSPRVRLRAADTRLALALLSEKLAEFEQAERLFGAAQKELNGLVQEAPENTEYAEAVVHAEIKWGWYCLQSKQNPELAETSFESAWQRLVKLSASKSENTEAMLQQATIGYSAALFAQGKWDQRDQMILKAYEQHGIMGPPLLGLMARTDPDRAAKLWREEIPRIQQRFQDQPSPGPVATLERAASFFGKYDVTEAIPIYEKALSANTQLILDYPAFSNSHRHFTTILSGWADARRKTLQTETLAADLRSLAERIPSRHIIPHRAIADEMRQCPEAEELLTSAIELKPDCAAYFYNRAIVYSDQGRSEESLDDLNQAEELAPPPDAISYFHRGKIYVKLNELERALADFNEAVEIGVPNHATDLFQHRGDLLTRLGRHQEALADYDTYLSRWGDDQWHIHKRKWTSHFSLGEYKKSIAEMRIAAEGAPTELSNLIWIRANLVAQCENEEFLKSYLQIVDQTVAANSNSLPALETRARILVEFGKTRQAYDDLRHVLNEGYGDYFSHYLTALLAIHHEDENHLKLECKRMLSKVNDVAEERNWAYFAGSACILKPDMLDDYEPVLIAARTLCTLEPENNSYRYLEGALLFRAGNLGLAKEKLLSALELASPMPVYFLALTEHQMGNADAALEYLKSARNQVAKKLASNNPRPWHHLRYMALIEDEACELLGADRWAEADKYLSNWSQKWYIHERESSIFHLSVFPLRLGPLIRH